MRMDIADKALNQLLLLAGRAVPDFVTIETEVPALKTRYYADEAAAAAIAAGAVIAADIWTSRGGEKQNVTVNSREAGAGLVGFLHQKFDDPQKAPPMRGQLEAARTAANGFKKTRD